MKKIVSFLIILVACSIAFVGLTGIKTMTPESNIPIAASAVRINLGGAGVCSGVHIGGGYILTAAHCTVGGKPMEVENANGGKVIGLVVAGIGQVSPFILMAPMRGGGCELLAKS